MDSGGATCPDEEGALLLRRAATKPAGTLAPIVPSPLPPPCRGRNPSSGVVAVGEEISGWFSLSLLLPLPLSFSLALLIRPLHENLAGS